MAKKRKAAAHDFNASFLPKNRREQYGDLVKNRLSFFFSIGGLLLLGSLLFLVAFVVKYLIVLPAARSASADDASYLAFVHTNTIVFDGIYLLTFLPIGLVLGGICRLIRQLAWGKGIFFWADFGKGIRQNAKTSLLLAFLFGLFHGLNDYLSLATPNVLRYLPAGLGYLLIPFGMGALVIASIYSASFSANLKSSVYIVAKSIGWVLLFLLFPFAWSSVAFIPYPVIRFFVDVVVIVVIAPFVLVGWYLLCLDRCDKTFNHRDYPEYENLGLQGEFQESEDSF